MGIPGHFCIFDYLIKHTETSADYLNKYSEVVELILKKESLRKVSSTTGISYATVAKVSSILKYGDSSQQPNEYLLKHSDVVKELMKGGTQREVSENLGVSLATVNTVAKIAEIDYIELNRKRGKIAIENWKIKTKNDQIILKFIEENYSRWSINLHDKINDEDVVSKFNNYLKTITAPVMFDKDRYKKITKDFTGRLIYRIKEDRKRQEIIERGRERVLKRQKENEEFQRLKKLQKIEDAKKSAIEFEKSQIEIRRYQQEELDRREKIRENLKKYKDDQFYNFLEAGINPWDSDWDVIPDEYVYLEHRMNPISHHWYEDQKLIFELRSSYSKLEDYANNNVKKFNFDLAEKLLRHIEFIRNKQFKESYDYIESAEPNVRAAIIRDKSSENNYDNMDFRIFTQKLYES